MNQLVTGIGIGLVLVFYSGPTSALESGDLDGQWCSGDGHTISVAGPMVTAANGLSATGVYSRNALTFVEPRTGGRDGPQIWMEPKGADAVRVSVVSAFQKEPPPHDLWRRCRTTS